MNKVKVAAWGELEPLSPAYALVSNVDLVVIRWKDEEQASVLYGRCLHRGALLSDGFIDGENLICGVHNWDYRYRTGVSEYNNEEHLNQLNPGDLTTWNRELAHLSGVAYAGVGPV